MNQKTKMRCTSQKGITLIALVITIIVLLILAGVTISMVLGDDGIIAQAQAAKEANEKATEKDEVAIKMAEVTTNEYAEGMTKKEVSDKTGGKIANATDGSIVEVKVFDNMNVPIPKGMTYLEGDSVDEGIVVVDKYGNEYVWVPVDGESVKLQLNSAYGADYTSQEGATDITDRQNVVGDMDQELADMRKSVATYGGFYVGRYETSWTGTKVASVPNKMALNNTMTIGEKKVNWAFLYQEQKKLHENSKSIVSGMIYGSQWDAIMDWMSDIVNENAFDPATENKYIFDSSHMGNYVEFCMDCETNGCEKCNYEGALYVDPIETGSNSNFAVKNIYDLAGNYREVTQETDGSFISVRGGGYDHIGINGDGYPASAREVLGGIGTVVTSRLQVYIK